MIVAIIGGAMIYAFALKTTLLKGFLISILAMVITLPSMILLAGLFASFSGVG